ncbi:MAG: ZIP family metal transporter [Bacteroidota bacterium]|nr:ZIP family metal transporter [Bacteroidota bacterium]
MMQVRIIRYAPRLLLFWRRRQFNELSFHFTDCLAEKDKELSLLMILLFTIITFFSTLAGGLFALRYKDKLRLILGFSAGAVIGVSFFDLLPESLTLGSGHYSPGFITAMVALGFFIYMILDRMTWLHSLSKEMKTKNHGSLAAGSLSVHSFFDGIAIGLAFQISGSIGIVVAVAVIVHDFSDGLNTVSLVLKYKRPGNVAFKWLLADSIAPVLGVVATFFFKPSEAVFAVILSLFTGFFFYIGATDLLPESQHNYPSVWTTCMTITGAATMYFAIRFLTF